MANIMGCLWLFYVHIYSIVQIPDNISDQQTCPKRDTTGLCRITAIPYFSLSGSQVHKYRKLLLRAGAL